MNDSVSVLADELKKSGINFIENEPLRNHSTFRIGGNARIFAVPSSEDELALVLSLATSIGVRTFITGRGSNVVFSDDGFDGAVISTLSLSNVEIDETKVSAGAGVSLTELAVRAAKRGLSGMEFSYGIPGSLGGAVFMNAGAYGGEMSDIVTFTRYYDRASGKFETIQGKSHKFGYRNSVFRERPDFVITGTELSLAEGKKEDVWEKMDRFMSLRREKQPLEYPSAGSAFKRYPGRYTAEMIDKAGLKGAAIGGAQVSEKHAGFIINRGGATSKDVRELTDLIRDKIRDMFEIEIESEIIFVE